MVRPRLSYRNMLSVSIGPLAFPVAPLIVLAAIWTGTAVATRVAGKDNAARAENSVWQAAIIGLIGARIGYLLAHHEAYRQHWPSMFDVRDGGWLTWAGFAAGGLWLLVRAIGQPNIRTAALAAATSVLAIWLPANVALWHFQGVTNEQPVPNLLLTSLDNEHRKPLAQILAGTPSVVNLWATWCGPCRVEMPVLANAQARNPDIQFIFVNQGEDANTIAQFLTRSQLSIEQVWLDHMSALGPAVGSAGLPTTLFYDANGHRVDAHFGILSAASLRARLKQLQ